MNHTPGPWHADKQQDRNAFNIFPAGATHALLTVVAPAHDGAHPYGQAAEANARLIAAAPDLLSALRIAREHVKAAAEADMCFARQQEQQHMYGNAAECRKQYDMRMCALSVIDAAIAGAEGA